MASEESGVEEEVLALAGLLPRNTIIGVGVGFCGVMLLLVRCHGQTAVVENCGMLNNVNRQCPQNAANKNLIPLLGDTSLSLERVEWGGYGSTEDYSSCVGSTILYGALNGTTR